MRRQFSLGHLTVTLFLALMFLGAGWCNLLEAQSLYPEQQNVIGPSPQAAAFTRYGDYPVNYNTGMVDMRVPVYTIKSGSLTLPIDISFHASGRMADDHTTFVTTGVLGFRWTLNAGGIITRTVHGYPDEWDELASYEVPQNQRDDSFEISAWLISGFETDQQFTDGWWLMDWLNPNTTADAPTFEELYYSNTESYYNNGGYRAHIGTYYDSEFDIFQYQLPSGKSGKFILKNENGLKKAFTIPYEPLEIKPVKGSGNEGLYISIGITDVDGTIYNYGGGNRYEYYDDTNYKPEPLPHGIPTAWYLESIVSADKQDTIQFNYQNGAKPNGTYKESYTVTDRTFGESDPLYGEEDLTAIQLLDFPGNPDFGFKDFPFLTSPYITSIDFKHGNVAFIYDGYYPPILNEILLTGDVSKKIKFNIDYFQNDLTLYLKDLEFWDVSNSTETVEKKYSFDYYKIENGMSLVPGKKDWWGYYNNNVVLNSDASNWYMSLFFQQVDYFGSSYQLIDIGDSGANTSRYPDFNSMKTGMLKSITYPTGGTTEFEYENNFYEDDGNKKEGPGLRISKITNKPVHGNDIVRTFKYGDLDEYGVENGMGYINPELKPYANLVKETRAMTFWASNNYFAYRLRTYSADPYVNFGTPITYYDKVTEYSSDELNKAWKTEYEYSHKHFDSKEYFVDDYLYSVEHPGKFSNPYGEWAGGKLKFKTMYKGNANIFTPVSKETYNYERFIFDGVWDMPTYRHVHFLLDLAQPPNTYNNTIAYWFDAEKLYNMSYGTPIGYSYRLYFSGAENLISKNLEYFYENENSDITKTNEYSFERLYNLTKTEKVTNSDGKVSRLEYEYPFESLTVPINSKMVDLNIVALPLKESQYISLDSTDIFLQSSRTEFGEWSPVNNNWNIDSNLEIDIIRPKTQYFKKGNGTEEPIIEFHSYYANGKVKEVSKTDGMHTVYVWGYQGEYPIAKIDNATFISSQPSTVTSNQQTLINNAVTAATNETTDITEDNLRAKLQLLREGFPNAMVTTYTYDPLVGVTSIIDPKGHTVYYGYDDFDRLKQVKDASGNILNENEYNYKQ